MKVAVTSEKSTLNALFDRRILEAAYFVIVDIDTGNYEVIRNQSQRYQKNTIIPCLNELVSRQVDIIITGKCDNKIIQELYNNGLRVYHGKNASVRNNVEEFAENHLLSCIHSNYLFNSHANTIDNSYNITDITEILAGTIPYKDEFQEKIPMNQSGGIKRLNKQI